MYSSGSEDRRDAYWAAMEEPEREYLMQVLELGAQERIAARDAPSRQQDYSQLVGYFYFAGIFSQPRILFARNEDHAKEMAVQELPPGTTITSITPMPIGKFSCPRCGNRYATSKRQIGCVVLIFLFVSCGIGLIMVPFLPHECRCPACKHKWKA